MAKAKPAVKKVKKAEREIIYPDVSAELFDGIKDRDLIDADMAKTMLGWTTEEQAGETFGEDFLLKDREGKKVRQTNNIINRPLYQSNVEALLQEAMEGRWKFNGEPIIITDSGLIANGQHQLTMLVLGQQDVEANQERYATRWPDGLKIPKLVVKGVPESDEVLNTMDTGKPRSLTDVLFRSDKLKHIKPHLRRSLANVLSFAVRVLWERTGAMRATEAYNPKRTTGEMLDFLARHEKLIKAVEHVWAEDEHNALSKYIKAGTAGALMYMMACSQSDPDAYFKTRRETKLKFGLWEQAEKFFTLLRDNADLKPVRDAIDGKKDPETGEANITTQERIALVIMGWRAFLANDTVKAKDLKLVYRPDEDTGEEHLAEFPTLGGIDLGPKVNQAEDDVDQDESDAETETEADAELAAMGDNDYQPDEEAEMMIEERAEEEGPKKVKPKKKKAKPADAEDD